MRRFKFTNPASFVRGRSGQPNLNATISGLPDVDREWLERKAERHGISMSECLRQIVQAVRTGKLRERG